MKVRIKKRTNELFALKPPGNKRKTYNIIKEEDSLHIDAIRELGFDNIEYISKGLYGSVYRGTWDQNDGVEHAIKVQPANTGKEEARVYKTISDARKGNKFIAKHFPRVDMARFDQSRNLVLIVMEILEDDPNAKSVIQDIFGQGEVGRFRPDLSLDDMDVQKNIGKRANLMITNEKTKEMVLDKMLYFAPNRQEEIKRNMMNLNFRGVKRQPKIHKAVNKEYKSGSDLFNLIDVMMEDLMYKDGGFLMGAEAFSFAIRFIYECMRAWKKDFDEGFDTLFKEIKPAIEDFINIYRQWTPVGVAPKGSGYLRGAPPETQGAGYPGVKSILKAIEELEAATGLQAGDMHDRNILIRPETKDIVIVDVGMFKQDASSRPARYDKDVTAMEEAFPHGGLPYGGSRKQDGDAEHAGHIQRAKHQGRREVMDEIIDEEIQAVLEKFSKKERAKRRKKCDNPKGFTMKQFCKNQRTRSKKGERKNEEMELEERCQKGYKTHPKRKTKKMYGKTYRNCVKAEGQEESEGDSYKAGDKVKDLRNDTVGTVVEPMAGGAVIELEDGTIVKTRDKFLEKVHKKTAYIQDKEGKPRDQAYDIAISMYEKGNLKEADPKKGTGKKPKGSGRRLYTDEDPSDTVSVSFKSVSAIQKTLAKKSFKAKSHKRQSQIINLIHQRARAAYQNAKDPKTKARLKKAYEYAKKRKEASKRKTVRLRKKK